MLRGSITLSSSLPTCAVSPEDTLRSLTTPSNGARTSVRCSCWRADTTRARAATRSLCALLRRTSASSSCLHRRHALGLQRFQPLHLPLGLVDRLRSARAPLHRPTPGRRGSRCHRVAPAGRRGAPARRFPSAPAAPPPTPRRADRRVARAGSSRSPPALRSERRARGRARLRAPAAASRCRPRWPRSARPLCCRRPPAGWPQSKGRRGGTTCTKLRGIEELGRRRRASPG